MLKLNSFGIFHVVKSKSQKLREFPLGNQSQRCNPNVFQKKLNTLHRRPCYKKKWNTKNSITFGTQPRGYFLSCSKRNPNVFQTCYFFFYATTLIIVNN